MGQGKSKSNENSIDLAITAASYENVSFREEQFDNESQTRNVAVWFPSTPDVKICGIIFLSHGLNEHTLCYHNLAAELVSKHGFVVCGMDHMAHGHSAGKKGVITDHTRLYRDFVRFVVAYKTKLSKEFTNKNGNEMQENGTEVLLPSFVFAHSMGTLIAMRALMEPELTFPTIQACVLSGIPLFAGKGAASPFGCGCLFPLTRTSVAPCLLSCTSVMDPAGPTAPIIVTEICGNPEYTQTLHLDPRRNKPILTNKTGFELYHLIEDLKRMIPQQFNIPFFAIHGEKDTIALKIGAEFVFKNSKTDLTQRKLYVAQDLKHEVIHEADPAGLKCRNMICEYFVEELKRAKEVTATLSGVVVEVEA